MIATDKEIQTELDILAAENCKEGQPLCDICKNTLMLSDMEDLTPMFIGLFLKPSLIPHICARFMQIGFNIAQKREMEKMVKFEETPL